MEIEKCATDAVCRLMQHAATVHAESRCIKEGFSNWVGGYRWVKGQLKCFKTADTEALQKWCE
jgi:hypothetical protein